MSIIIHTEADNIDYSKYNIYPDQFVSAKRKQSDEWIKESMDYFANVAYSQYIKSLDTFLHNYNLVKGNLRPLDFYIEDNPATIKDFMDTLGKDTDLPAHVKHYPIINAPLNELIGELSNRPDASRVKAFDEESKNEELQFKTEIVQQYIIQEAKQKLMGQMAMQGQKIDDEKIQQLTMEKVQEYLTDYTSLAEKWGNHVLEAAKMNFNLKEVGEDCMRDMLISAREFVHIFEINNKLGMGVENLNPKNVWYLTLPDKKYLKDAFASGTVHVMELSEIIDRFPTLSKKEIDHLRDGIRELSIFNPRESNFENPNISGWDSIKYDTYSPLILQQRMMIESELKQNEDPLSDFLGLSSNVNTFGNKYVVIQAYWLSKKKVGKIHFRDENGEIQTALIDESYIKSPNQIGSIEWTWVNQWYKGYKIGPDVYHVEEFKLLPYSPILGVCYEVKNVDEAKSFVDLIKPYQIIFNVCMNQIWRLLEKEIGQVQVMSIRHIPSIKDGDDQDAIELWEQEARKRGVMFIDDSPENLKAPSSFNQFTSMDLTRTKEIQSRYELAIEMKNLAWELAGTTKERLGNVKATSTATGVNTAVAQSYAQTEPYFAQHEYVMNDLFQAILDGFQYVETQKPYSTISYINTQGEQAFIKVNSEDINLRDLQVFVTSRKKDQQEFEQIKSLAQPMLQNGATPYEVIELYTTNSIRQMRQVFKNLKDKQEQMAEKQQQLEELKMQQEQKQHDADQQRQEQDAAEQRAFEHGENELDRLNKKEIEYIKLMASEKVPAVDVPNDLEMQKLDQDSRKADMDREIELRKIEQKQSESDKHIQLEMEKISVERARISADLAKLRAGKTPPKKSKKK